MTTLVKRQKFIPRPIEIEAVQLRHDNVLEMQQFVGAYGLPGPCAFVEDGVRKLAVPVMDTYIIAEEGDWVCKNDEGLFTVYVDEVFGKLWMKSEPGNKTTNYATQHEYVCVRCYTATFHIGDVNIPDRIGCPACLNPPMYRFVWMLPSSNPMFALKEAYRNAARRV